MNRIATALCLAALLGLAACTTKSPAERAAISAKYRAEVQTRVSQELGPLLPICLDALDTGAEVGARLQALGYKRHWHWGYISNLIGTKGYKYGANTSAFKMTEDGACQLVILDEHNVDYVVDSFAVVLDRNGYTKTGWIDRRTLGFSKGDETLNLQAWTRRVSGQHYTYVLLRRGRTGRG